MISFYPGPSKVHDQIPQYVKDAHKAGILSINHRSAEFIDISKETIRLLKAKLKIPKTYTIFFTSSATECWEIIAQSFITNKSLHFHNGAFGQKWFDYTNRLNPKAQSIPFPVEAELNFSTADVNPADVICITHNETSNGTQVSKSIIKKIRKQFPKALIAVDATSSMAGIKLDFKQGDIWFASVQKCFGLPAGLALMVCSPNAISSASALGEKQHYNSVVFMKEMMEKWQTSYTPNVLGIYLLMRVLKDTDPIEKVESRIIGQYRDWNTFLKGRKLLSHFVANEKVHSFTVVPVKTDSETLVSIKKKAKAAGLLLGEGYGPFKPLTFRIANFPALKPKEINALRKFLKSY